MEEQTFFVKVTVLDGGMVQLSSVSEEPLTPFQISILKVLVAQNGKPQ